MPAEFQKAMNYTLIGLKNSYCFLDEISKGSLEQHKCYVMNCLKQLDENLRINLPKCHFGKLEIDYHNSQSGISPLESKTSAILALQAPKTLKKNSVLFWGRFITLVNIFQTMLKLVIPSALEKDIKLYLDGGTQKLF